MGCSCSVSQNVQYSPYSEASSRVNSAPSKRPKSIIKLLLLGAGESGKSTFLKQMRIIHCKGYTSEERGHFRYIIIDHVIRSTKATIVSIEQEGLLKNDQALAKACEAFNQEIGTPLNYACVTNMASALRGLWNHPRFKLASENPNIGINENTDYFVENFSRIFSQDFVPTDQDILCARMETTGVVELNFDAKGSNFRVIDVGGQRSQRRKWLHCFDDVTTVIFIVALSEYDQHMREDNSKNRMEESFELFCGIANARVFRKTSMLLFLNKTDIFRGKLKTTPISTYFPEYAGGANYDESCRFIERKFKDACKTQNRQIYTYFTCATDTKQSQAVFDVSFDIITGQNLWRSGIA